MLEQLKNQAIKDFMESEFNRGFVTRFADGLHQDFESLMQRFGEFGANRCQFREGYKDFDFTQCIPEIIKHIYSLKTQALIEYTEMLLKLDTSGETKLVQL